MSEYPSVSWRYSWHNGLRRRPPLKYKKRRLPRHVARALDRCIRGKSHPQVEGQLKLF